MNGEIPSVPITTLAGITSLTDLLPEMSLPSPIIQTVNSRSLLFHPRVAEEARRLLNTQDDILISQLVHTLLQTSSDHIELKDSFPVDENICENIPYLLKGILQVNSNVFKGEIKNKWNHHCKSSTSQNSLTCSQIFGDNLSVSHLQNSSTFQALTNEVNVYSQSSNKLLNFSNINNSFHPLVNTSEQNSKISNESNFKSSFNSIFPQSHGCDISFNSNFNNHLNHSDKLASEITNSMSLMNNVEYSVCVSDCSQSQVSLQPNDDLRTTIKCGLIRNNDKEIKVQNMELIKNAITDLELNHESSTIEAVMKNETLLESCKKISQNSPNSALPNHIDHVDHKQTLITETSSNLNNNHTSEQMKQPESKNNRITRNTSLNLSYKEMSLYSESDDEEILPNTKYFKSKAKERELQRKKGKSDVKKGKGDPNSDDGFCGDLFLIKKIQKIDSDKEEMSSSKKPKVRKVEKCLIPVIEKMSIEELKESNAYQRFNIILSEIFECTEDNCMGDPDEDTEIPQEILLTKYKLQDLSYEAAKLKLQTSMEFISAEKLIKLLNILEKNISDGIKVSLIMDPDGDECENRLWIELATERILRAADACLASLYILTSKNMPKKLYLDEVIEKIALFIKFQLTNTVYPIFDPVYRDPRLKDGILTNLKKKRAHAKEVREKSILQLYGKLNEAVGLLAELLDIQILTDGIILKLSSVGVTTFFVENIYELQLSTLRLVIKIFTHYIKHRRLLLDDILASIARLPSSKRGLRTYRLQNSPDTIQMLTALVLQLIQCVISLPTTVFKNYSVNEELLESGIHKKADVDIDVIISSQYDLAKRTAANFLSVFLTKCNNKGDEFDYRPLFENFIQDLLTTVNRPEWPAAELLLSLLGKLLVQNFIQKNIEVATRVASLDYLGVIAARLRKDALLSTNNISAIDQLIDEIKEKELEQDIENNKLNDIKETKEERILFLQGILLDYLSAYSNDDPALLHARQFLIAQWYTDAHFEVAQASEYVMHNVQGKQDNNFHDSKERKDVSSDEDSSLNCGNEGKHETKMFHLIQSRRKFLLKKIQPFKGKLQSGKIIFTELDYDSAKLVAQFLSSKREFSLSFDLYLKQILRVLTEQAIAVRARAMKCLTVIVEADPNVLGRQDMQMGVNHSFLDHSTSVREAAVDLVGKFVLSKPELLDKYYEMISARILDTGVSVRKRVIKIMKDVCTEYPNYPRIPEMCVKMIKRINDEEGIKKLVQEVFQNMWFTPLPENNIEMKILLRKVMNITDVVVSCQETGLDWFEQLLLTLFKTKEDKENSTKSSVDSLSVLCACKQIADCLVQKILQLEEIPGEIISNCDQNDRKQSRIVACMQTLALFAKICPKLLINHAITLQPYLSLKCQNKGDDLIISCVARVLELVVPLLEHPSETFLAQLEEDCVKLILQHEKNVVQSCMSCLSAIVNNVTHNYCLIKDCFIKYLKTIQEFKVSHETNHQMLSQHRPWFRRSLFTIGLLLRHFNFKQPEVYQDLQPNIIEHAMEILLYFMEQTEEDMQNYTLQAVGFICIQYSEFMLRAELRLIYSKILTQPYISVMLKVRVLNNLEMYLIEEENKMIKENLEWDKQSKSENIKEMGEMMSGMASTIIQVYLKDILQSFLHLHLNVRRATIKVVQLIVNQGLVYPMQILPYLICMSTDREQSISHTAAKLLEDIEKKFPGFTASKAMLGIKLSYEFQEIIQSQDGKELIRGFQEITSNPDTFQALNGFVYSLLRTTKHQRRSIILQMLKQFEDHSKYAISHYLYFADNLAYFPYQVLDELLFMIHHIDIIVSVSGSNVLQTFHENLRVIENENLVAENVRIEEDDDDDVDVLIKRLPNELKVLQECILMSKTCILLLMLRQHLKYQYGITDSKIAQYSPSEGAKINEKSISRKNFVRFSPESLLIQAKETGKEEEKKNLITQYLELMMQLDPVEDDEFPHHLIRGKNDDESIKNFQKFIAEEGGIIPEGKLPKLSMVHSKNSKQLFVANKKSPIKLEKSTKKKRKKRRVLDSSDDSELYDSSSDPDYSV